MTIVPFLRDNVFEPPDIYAMSTALHDVCLILNITDAADSEKRLLATEIIAFVHQEPHEAALLRDRMLREIVSGRGVWRPALVRAARQGALEVK